MAASLSRQTLVETLIFIDNFLFILITYLDLLKCGSIGKGIAAKAPSGINTVGSGEDMGNFDQWTEGLSKQVIVQSDEEDKKALSKANEMFNDDDFEEEE